MRAKNNLSFIEYIRSMKQGKPKATKISGPIKFESSKVVKVKPVKITGYVYAF